MLFHSRVARIIALVNFTFLIVIAIPLALYLVVMLFTTRDLGVQEEVQERLHETLPDSAHNAVAESTAELDSHSALTESLAASHAASDVIQDRPISSEVAPANETAGVKRETSNTARGASNVKRETSDVTSETAQVSDVTAVASLETASVKPIETAAVAAAENAAVSEQASDAARPASESAAGIETPQAEPEQAAPAVGAAQAATITEPISSEQELNELVESETDDPDEPILPEGLLDFPSKDSPKYAFDYRGRLWVEKKNKGFFRQLRRPQLPPDDPPGNSGR